MINTTGRKTAKANELNSIFSSQFILNTYPFNLFFLSINSNGHILLFCFRCFLPCSAEFIKASQRVCFAILTHPSCSAIIPASILAVRSYNPVPVHAAFKLTLTSLVFHTYSCVNTTTPATAIAFSI